MSHKSSEMSSRYATRAVGTCLYFLRYRISVVVFFSKSAIFVDFADIGALRELCCTQKSPSLW